MRKHLSRDMGDIFSNEIYRIGKYHIWRRKWQPIPVFLPRESLGHRSLVGCCPWGRTELDTTEAP